MHAEVEKIKIANEADVTYYANRFVNGPEFAIGFEFDSDELYNKFFEAIGVGVEAFQQKYYYYDNAKKIHISESEKGYLWVSNMGLVAQSTITPNKYVNACISQAVVLSNLLDEAIALCDDETSYDIDSYSYSRIQTLTPALFHNTIFYYEVLAKAYLSLNGICFPRIHKIKKLSEMVRDTMFKKGHNDTLFHAHVIAHMEKLTDHISNIPGDFNEAFVKYDDNPGDATIVMFHATHLGEVKDFVDLSCDIIWDLYYDPNLCNFLRPGLLDRLLDKCQTEEAKNAIRKIYGFLADNK